ncbi:NAD-dependent succinate-semialdehyde dehydrogenase [Dactylosporangium sp. CA-092794]|uniref:NAD-dependent succinate-semialdehyde dehydrogenase n=1 Tax=Dactylosporangium sp. CA-092794 TaxID=3239929 RepID=UPI003D909BF0
MSGARTAEMVIGGVDKGLMFGGKVLEAAGGSTFGVENPATGEVLCEVADATPADAMAALDAAVAAQRSWAATPPRERAEILRRTYELLMARIDEIALLITLEMGKSLAESRSEVIYSAEFFRWFGEEAVRINGSWKINEAGTGRILVTHQPVGTALLITPWNVPLAMPARKVAAAAAAGCTMIVKPAPQTPLTMLMLASLLAEAGLPPGVLNVIPTTSASAATRPLMEDRRLRKISFTGSTEVGRILLRQAAQNVMRTSMELGGNAPFIVCADADLDAAVEGAMVAKMRNIGEACIAANRFYVHAGVAEEFTERLTARMSRLRVGNGTDPGTDVGPLIDAAQRDKVAMLVGDAVDRGARIRTGGAVPGGAGYFYPPTVLRDVARDSRIVKEEIFGPVAAVQTFTTDDEAIHAANDTEFGLVGYLFTRDIERAIRLSERLESGMVGLNRGYISDPSAPFGGIKQSGTGREGGDTGIDEYLDTKYIAVNVAGP